MNSLTLAEVDEARALLDRLVERGGPMRARLIMEWADGRRIELRGAGEWSEVPREHRVAVLQNIAALEQQLRESGDDELARAFASAAFELASTGRHGATIDLQREP